MSKDTVNPDNAASMIISSVHEVYNDVSKILNPPPDKEGRLLEQQVTVALIKLFTLVINNPNLDKNPMVKEEFLNHVADSLLNKHCFDSEIDAQSAFNFFNQELGPEGNYWVYEKQWAPLPLSHSPFWELIFTLSYRLCSVTSEADPQSREALHLNEYLRDSFTKTFSSWGKLTFGM